MTLWGIRGGSEHACQNSCEKGWVGQKPGQGAQKDTSDAGLTCSHTPEPKTTFHALGCSASVLVLVSQVAAHPNDLTLLLPAFVVFFVFSIGDCWRTTIVLFWQTKYLIPQNGSMTNRSQSSFQKLSYKKTQIKRQSLCGTAAQSLSTKLTSCVSM